MVLKWDNKDTFFGGFKSRSLQAADSDFVLKAVTHRVSAKSQKMAENKEYHAVDSGDNEAFIDNDSKSALLSELSLNQYPHKEYARPSIF